jgi:hypothetical protein
LELEGLPELVRRFLADHIHSVVQLEALLLVASSPPREWTPDELAGELRVEVAWAHSQLTELCSRGLLECSERGGLYRYNPKTAELDAAVKALAAAYRERRVAVIAFIYAKPPDPIRGFADAFRLRKPKDKADG